MPEKHPAGTHLEGFPKYAVPVRENLRTVGFRDFQSMAFHSAFQICRLKKPALYFRYYK